jgi:hypothetical protein
MVGRCVCRTTTERCFPSRAGSLTSVVAVPSLPSLSIASHCPGRSGCASRDRRGPKTLFARNLGDGRGATAATRAPTRGLRRPVWDVALGRGSRSVSQGLRRTGCPDHCVSRTATETHSLWGAVSMGDSCEQHIKLGARPRRQRAAMHSRALGSVEHLFDAGNGRTLVTVAGAAAIGRHLGGPRQEPAHKWIHYGPCQGSVAPTRTRVDQGTTPPITRRSTPNQTRIVVAHSHRGL